MVDYVTKYYDTLSDRIYTIIIEIVYCEYLLCITARNCTKRYMNLSFIYLRCPGFTVRTTQKSLVQENFFLA